MEGAISGGVGMAVNEVRGEVLSHWRSDADGGFAAFGAYPAARTSTTSPISIIHQLKVQNSIAHIDTRVAVAARSKGEDVDKDSWMVPMPSNMPPHFTSHLLGVVQHQLRRPPARSLHPRLPHHSSCEHHLLCSPTLPSPAMLPSTDAVS